MKRVMGLIVLLCIYSFILVGCSGESENGKLKSNSTNNIEDVTDTVENQGEYVTEHTETNSEVVVDTDYEIDTETDTEDTDYTATIEVEFNNYKSMYYDVTMYDNMTYGEASIKKANYMPELSIVCIDVLITDPQYEYATYIARLGSSSDPSKDYSKDKLFTIDYSGESNYLCINDLKQGENYIHIIRSVSFYGWASTLLTLHYNDEDFSNRSKLTYYSINNKTESSVDLGVDPNITFDFVVGGDRDAIGKLILKVFDLGTGDVIHENEFSKEDLVFENNLWNISDYKVEGLSPHFKYHVAMLYFPASNINEAVVLDTADLYSSSITGLNSVAQYHNIYADIYGVEYGTISTTFKTYIKNNDTFIDESTNKPFALAFHVFSEAGEILYSVPVIDQQETVEIPNEYLNAGGYVIIEIDDYDKELSKEVLAVNNIE